MAQTQFDEENCTCTVIGGKKMLFILKLVMSHSSLSKVTLLKCKKCPQKLTLICMKVKYLKISILYLGNISAAWLLFLFLQNLTCQSISAFTAVTFVCQNIDFLFMALFCLLSQGSYGFSYNNPVLLLPAP